MCLDVAYLKSSMMGQRSANWLQPKAYKISGLKPDLLTRPSASGNTCDESDDQPVLVLGSLHTSRTKTKTPANARSAKSHTKPVVKEPVCVTR